MSEMKRNMSDLLIVIVRYISLKENNICFIIKYSISLSKFPKLKYESTHINRFLYCSVITYINYNEYINII